MREKPTATGPVRAVVLVRVAVRGAAFRRTARRSGSRRTAKRYRKSCGSRIPKEGEEAHRWQGPEHSLTAAQEACRSGPGSGGRRMTESGGTRGRNLHPSEAVRQSDKCKRAVPGGDDNKQRTIEGRERNSIGCELPYTTGYGGGESRSSG